MLKKLKLQVHYTHFINKSFLKHLKFESKNFLSLKILRKEVSIPIFYNLGKSTQKKLYLV